MAASLSVDLLRKMDAYWRAANYLSVGQIYLFGNPLLRRPLTLEHIKPRLLGHWGTTPGLNFVYVHLNRLIKEQDLDMIYVAGPGHGGPGIVANTYLEGTYSEVYPDISQDAAGMQRLFKQFSFPGGIPSHVAPETPGSIHEGGELGYSLTHAYGAAFDNPGLIVACVVGDGEAETGPLAASWHSNKFLDAARDGAVLPILHLNGYKINNPTLLARIPHEELEALFRGYGYAPYFVEGDDPEAMHQLMAGTLDRVLQDIRQIQAAAREDGVEQRPRWPMIVLRSPKGWTGPKVVDGKPAEGSWRSHQVPFSEMEHNPGHVKLLEKWMRSYRPQELFDKEGRLIAELRDLPPKGARRMSANPHTNGGTLLRDLRLPDFSDYAVQVPSPGAVSGEATRVLGQFLRDVMKLNMEPANFRVFGPDETASNRLGALFEATSKTFDAILLKTDENLAPNGRVMEVLSEHLCEGWLEGYLLTGRHGLFNCYEAFIHIIDSMFNQHAKWLSTTRRIPWRRPIASLNYLLSSHVWRQDHNGFSHQDPGFIDHVVNKKAGVVRVYLPPDANSLLSVASHCLRSRHYINVIVAGKQPAPQWLSMDEAIKHCTAGIGMWTWAGTDGGDEPDVVMACCGDVPTLETLAAVSLLRDYVPGLKIRVVNVVDLMKLQPPSEHPHGLPDRDFDALFTRDKPVIFAYHGYPWLIHRLTYRRANHANLHVRGYKEEGTTTTPFDTVVMNDLDRFHLMEDVVERVPSLSSRVAQVKQLVRDKLIDHKAYIRQHGQDMPEIREWRWSPTSPANVEAKAGGGSRAAPRAARTELAPAERRGNDQARSAADMNILVLNAGSSTLKFRLLALHEPADDEPRVLVDGLVDHWGTARAVLRIAVSGQDVTHHAVAADSPGDAAEHAIGACLPHHIDAVGHRVVHGGPRFVGPARITPEVVKAIREASSLAPLHNSNALEGIEAAMRVLPLVPAVAVFDTAFHSTMPEVASRYAVPVDLAGSHHLRRYGFHGISHRYVSRRLIRCLGRDAAGTRVITCHLGSGASVCAVRNGCSVDTSMGLTPMEGLVMSTRCGDIDPGLVLHLITALSMSAAQVDDLLNHQSGLLGVSGCSGDVREVERAALAGDGNAELALEIFAYRARKYVGAYAAALGGLDAIGFAGGIGEHSPTMRARICQGLQFLGISIDPLRNSGSAEVAPRPIGVDGAPVQVWVVPTDEEGQIARELYDLLQ